jgi:hypothetical protein
VLLWVMVIEAPEDVAPDPTAHSAPIETDLAVPHRGRGPKRSADVIEIRGPTSPGALHVVKATGTWSFRTDPTDENVPEFRPYGAIHGCAFGGWNEGSHHENDGELGGGRRP